MQSSRCRVSRRIPVSVLELLSIGARQLRGQILARRRLELIRRQSGPLEVLIQLLDRQLEIFAARLKSRALDERDRALQDRGSFLRGARHGRDLPAAPGALIRQRTRRESAPAPRSSSRARATSNRNPITASTPGRGTPVHSREAIRRFKPGDSLVIRSWPIGKASMFVV